MNNTIKIPTIQSFGGDVTISREEYHELVGLCKYVLALPLKCSEVKMEILKLRAHTAKRFHQQNKGKTICSH